MMYEIRAVQIEDVSTRVGRMDGRKKITATTRARVLMVDDEPALLAAHRRAFELRGFEIQTCDDPREALRLVQQHTEDYDLLMLDLNMPGMSGIQLLEGCLDVDRDLPVIMLTSDFSADSAVRALKAGAFNYLTKPIPDFDAAAIVMRGAAKLRQLQREVSRLSETASEVERSRKLVGSSNSMKDLLAAIDRIAPHNVSVLIRGESGTGKELAARELHARSPRASGPFVALNCAAIPETLVDSELFGHTKGAFTGATESRAGAFERASHGTLFLDEIGDIPLSVQTRLLRVLQEQETTRLGSGTPIKIDVRVLAATLVDLEAAIKDNSFREDLYYRLDVVTLDLPALRHRLDDLPLLGTFLLRKHAERMGLQTPQLTAEANEALSAYHWPGNVRELENAMQYALTLAKDGMVTPRDLPPKIQNASSTKIQKGAVLLEENVDDEQLAWCDEIGFMEARQIMQERFEKAYLTRLMRKTGGNVSESARRTGLDRSNLRRAMTRNGVKPEDFVDNDES